MSTFEELKASGNEHFKQKDYLAAIADYTKAIIAAPEEVALYSNRAACYLALKQWDDAIADSRKAAEVDRTFIKGYVRGAKAYTAKGEFVEALKLCNTALLHDPMAELAHTTKREIELAMARVKRAKELIATGSFGQAASMLAGVIAVAPDSTEVPILQVECLLGKRDYDGAFTMVTALMRKGSSLKLVYLRGKALFYQGEIDKAEKHLAEAVRGDPENTEFIKLLRLIKKMLRAKQEGNDAFKRGDNDAAVEAYTAAMAIEPANTKFAAVLLSNRAAAHMNARRYEAVIVDCGKAIDLDAENPKTYLRRARAAMELGGKDHIEQAIRDYNAAKDLVGPGQQRDIKRDLQKAQAALKQAKRKDYYKILNVPRGADDREIKAAFRKGALKWHPDRHVTKTDEEKLKAAEMFKDVNEANSVLSDPKKRQRYDNGVDIEHLDEEDHGMGGMGGMGGGIDPSMFFSMFGGGGGMGGMGGGMPRGFRFG